MAAGVTDVDELLARVRDRVAVDFGPEDGAHDLSHLDRVSHNCRTISAKEGGDLLVLSLAAYLHDYHRVLERRAGSVVHPEDALEPVAHVLSEVDVPDAVQRRVLACVAATDKHSFAGDFGDFGDCGLEEGILRDADALDALGAIGIARTLMFAGSVGEPLWRSNVAISGFYDHESAASVIHHFYEKLLRLRDDMVTATGRHLAEDRHNYMLGYLEQISKDCAMPLPSVDPLAGQLRWRG